MLVYSSIESRVFFFLLKHLLFQGTQTYPSLHHCLYPVNNTPSAEYLRQAGRAAGWLQEKMAVVLAQQTQPTGARHSTPPHTEPVVQQGILQLLIGEMR